MKNLTRTLALFALSGVRFTCRSYWGPGKRCQGKRCQGQFLGGGEPIAGRFRQRTIGVRFTYCREMANLTGLIQIFSPHRSRVLPVHSRIGSRAGGIDARRRREGKRCQGQFSVRRAFADDQLRACRSGDQGHLTHPQPQNPRAQTSQPLRATPKPLHASLHALRATPRPSRPTLATSQRQGSKHRARRFQRWPRGFLSRARPFDPCVRRRGPSHSEAFGLALRSFSLARMGGSVAREGHRVAREGETVAGGVQTVAGEGGELRGRRWRGGKWGVYRCVRACRGVFRNSPTGA